FRAVCQLYGGVNVSPSTYSVELQFCSIRVNVPEPLTVTEVSPGCRCQSTPPPGGMLISATIMVRSGLVVVVLLTGTTQNTGSGPASSAAAGPTEALPSSATVARPAPIRTARDRVVLACMMLPFSGLCGHRPEWRRGRCTDHPQNCVGKKGGGGGVTCDTMTAVGGGIHHVGGPTHAVG